MAIVYPTSGEYDPRNDPDPTIRAAVETFENRGWIEAHRFGLESELPPSERAFRNAVSAAHIALRLANERRDDADRALKKLTEMADLAREELAALLDNLPPQSPKS